MAGRRAPKGGLPAGGIKGAPAAVLRTIAGRKVAKECRGSGGVDFVRVSEPQPSSEASAGKLPTLLGVVIAELRLVGEVDDHGFGSLGFFGFGSFFNSEAAFSKSRSTARGWESRNTR